jgi:hypothetical protein
VEDASMEDLEAARNRLVAGELHNMQDWFSVLHAQAVEDFTVIDEIFFLNTWMDVNAEDGTWVNVLQTILWMRDNLDL